MGTDLDLDDCAADNPVAEQELKELRNKLAAAQAINNPCGHTGA